MATLWAVTPVNTFGTPAGAATAHIELPTGSVIDDHSAETNISTNDFLEDTSFYPLELAHGIFDASGRHHGRRRQKRAHDSLEASASSLACSDSETIKDWSDCSDAMSISPEVQALFPELFPQRPSLQHLVFGFDNPFHVSRLDNGKRHPSVRPSSGPSNGPINGYIKFIIKSASQLERDGDDEPRFEGTLPSGLGIRNRSDVWPSLGISKKPSGIPPEFGSHCKLDAVDRKLLRFYSSAVCAGRTLLPKSNTWLLDLASMADANECVRHAALALSAGYMLDYLRSEKLLVRANYHYKRASELLSSMLADASILEVGKEGAAVGALRLLWADDIVQWELRQAGDRTPRWRMASRLAKQLLDHTDPGHRYWKPRNVQFDGIRRGNANMCAYVDICAHPVTELRVEDTNRLYAWLLEGTEEEVRQIYGGTGVCPKLLHMYAQITQLSARMMQDPTSPLLEVVAEALLARLDNFRQTSEMSEGYETTQELLESCILDVNGLVQCPIKVTELTGECWVQAAKIYLLCRFYRLPRSDRQVQKHLSVLLRCIERMPTRGWLFTAQSPFICIFLSALVAYKERDRKVLRNWFEPVVSRASARSSVPPIWQTIETYWQWIDNDPLADASPNGNPDVISIHLRHAWWEGMVAMFLNTVGQMSLV